MEGGWFLPHTVALTPSCPQGAFPARLKKVFIVGAPMWFRVPYSIISLLLKEKLRERVSAGTRSMGPLGRTGAGFLLGQDGVSSLCPSAPSAEPKSMGNRGFLSLLRRSQPALVFSASSFGSCLWFLSLWGGCQQQQVEAMVKD